MRKDASRHGSSTREELLATLGSIDGGGEEDESGLHPTSGSAMKSRAATIRREPSYIGFETQSLAELKIDIEYCESRLKILDNVLHRHCIKKDLDCHHVFNVKQKNPVISLKSLFAHPSKKKKTFPSLTDELLEGSVLKISIMNLESPDAKFRLALRFYIQSGDESKMSKSDIISYSPSGDIITQTSEEGVHAIIRPKYVDARKYKVMNKTLDGRPRKPSLQKLYDCHMTRAELQRKELYTSENDPGQYVIKVHSPLFNYYLTYLSMKHPDHLIHYKDVFHSPPTHTETLPKEALDVVIDSLVQSSSSFFTLSTMLEYGKIAITRPFATPNFTGASPFLDPLETGPHGGMYSTPEKEQINVYFTIRVKVLNKSLLEDYDELISYKEELSKEINLREQLRKK